MQTHIVIDRHSRPHTLQPGQRKHDVELPNEDIANFQQERRPDRVFPPGSRLAGQLKPLHPIVIEGVASMLQIGDRYE